MSKAGKWFSGLSNGGKFALIGGAAFLSLVGISAAASAPAPKPPAVVHKVHIEEVSDKTTIPFSTKNQDDNTLAQGTTKTSQEGVNGERTTTYKVTYTDDKETKREKTNESVTKAPVDKIILTGTYVAPVATPTPEPAPAATQQQSTGARTGAVCKDGSPSTATGSGACSHHGGVAYWTYN